MWGGSAIGGRREPAAAAARAGAHDPLPSCPRGVRVRARACPRELRTTDHPATGSAGLPDAAGATHQQRARGGVAGRSCCVGGDGRRG